jgi:hypothetical protein
MPNDHRLGWRALVRTLERLEQRDVPAVVSFAEAGSVFNDATRALEGGLWQNVVAQANQGNGSVFRYVDDLTTVKKDLQAEINAGQFGGTVLTKVNTILSDIATALAAAPASVNGGSTFGSVAAAETALRSAHVDILNIVEHSPHLSAAATANGANGFQQVPQRLVGVTAANAPHDNLAQIGAIFNDAANRILGGVNPANAGAITDDVNALIKDLRQLIAQNPTQFGGLTGIHADTVVRQLQLQLSFIQQAGVNVDAGRASNDNMLDIMDIVQGDVNLVNQANQSGISGFAAFPDALKPTPQFQDNQDQTNFWANFIAQSNALGRAATKLVTNDPGNTDAINALIARLQRFQQTVTDFDAAQGGIFEARFDNELLGETSTLGAEVAAMLKGLKSGNQYLVAAAAQEMHANAADVGGNNAPFTGGFYNTDGLTVAQVLSTAM